MWLEVLDEETCWNWFCCVSTHIDKPADYRVNHSNNQGHVPKTHIGKPDVSKDEAEKSRNGNGKNICNEPAVLNGIIIADELIIEMANFGAFPGRVAIRNACKIDIWVYICPDQIKHIVKAEEITFTAFASSIAPGILVAGE